MAQSGTGPVGDCGTSTGHQATLLRARIRSSKAIKRTATAGLENLSKTCEQDSKFHRHCSKGPSRRQEMELRFVSAKWTSRRSASRSGSSGYSHLIFVRSTASAGNASADFGFDPGCGRPPHPGGWCQKKSIRGGGAGSGPRGEAPRVCMDHFHGAAVVRDPVPS